MEDIGEDRGQVATHGAIQTMEPAATYPRAALRDEGFTERELQWFRRVNLLPKAVGTGPTAYYTDVHLAILRRIKRARDDYRSLADIREMLEMGNEP